MAIKRFSLESISEIRTSNDFEKSIFALLDGVKTIECIKSFQLTAQGVHKYKERFDGKFFGEWLKAFRDGDQPNRSAPAQGSPIEVDCLVRLKEGTTLFDVCKGITAGAKENVLCVNQSTPQCTDIQFQPDDYLLIEITDGSSKIPKKLFQLERTMEFWGDLVGGPFPKALVLILNGSIENVNKCLSGMRLSEWRGDLRKPHLFTVPCYICFKPYANVYTILTSLRTRVDSVQTRVDSVQTRVDSLQTSVDSVKSGLRWSMMSDAQLAAECCRSGLSDDEIRGKSRVELFDLLMSHC